VRSWPWLLDQGCGTPAAGVTWVSGSDYQGQGGGGAIGLLGWPDPGRGLSPGLRDSRGPRPPPTAVGSWAWGLGPIDSSKGWQAASAPELAFGARTWLRLSSTCNWGSDQKLFHFIIYFVNALWPLFSDRIWEGILLWWIGTLPWLISPELIGDI
jgi:hypothetical protein